MLCSEQPYGNAAHRDRTRFHDTCIAVRLIASILKRSGETTEENFGDLDSVACRRTRISYPYTKIEWIHGPGVAHLSQQYLTHNFKFRIV